MIEQFTVKMHKKYKMFSVIWYLKKVNWKQNQKVKSNFLLRNLFLMVPILCELRTVPL